MTKNKTATRNTAASLPANTNSKKSTKVSMNDKCQELTGGKDYFKE